MLSSLPSIEARVLLTRAQVTAYRFDHLVPDPAAGPNDKRETYMEAYDVRGDFAPSHQTEGVNRVHTYVAYHFQRPPSQTHTAWHARYLGALAAAVPAWAIPINDLKDMKALPILPLDPIEFLVRTPQDLQHFEEASVPEPKAARRQYPPASYTRR